MNTTTTNFWTKNYLVDRLKQHLAIFEETQDNSSSKRIKVYDSRKYYNQAHHLLKIGAFKPVPPFIILLSDLTPRLVKELYELDNKDRTFVLRQAVGRIFEDVNPEIYHNSVSRVLRVRLQ